MNRGSRALLIAIVGSFLTIAASAQRVAQPSQARGCRLQGSWLAEVDIGGRFFVQYGGMNAAGGSLTIDWVRFDPTLFGNFPAAVRVTQGIGGWVSNGQGYDYTWMAYGLDSAGAPVYAIKTSGSGTLDECDSIDFNYVLEVFPAPMNPLSDRPATCLSGHGSKVRLPVLRATCP